jgi:hypothetical protein
MTDASLFNQQVAEGYEDFETQIARRVGNIYAPLFTTSVPEGSLWGHFIMNLPEERRQHYNCHACKRFVERYMGLAYIDKDGDVSPLFSLIPSSEFFHKAQDAVMDLVLNAKITGVFLSSDKVWGTPTTEDKKRHCEWTHLHGTQPKPFRHSLLSAEQMMAEKLEDFKMLNHAVLDYSTELVEQAVRVLKADALGRSEKALAIAEWFLEVTKSNKNQIWLAVATAPPGFCHIRSTMISTLLDDIKAGLSFDQINARWSEKMHPLQYQRPQAAPKEGAIENAEKIVEKLGIAKSLDRQFATLDDVLSFLWRENEKTPSTQKSDGVFGHLKNSPTVKEVQLPTKTMTWEKFSQTVLPGAKVIEAQAPRIGAYYGLVTALDKDAPAILQWDIDHPINGEKNARNPVSWYFYNGGSPASHWSLTPGFNKVTAVFYPPHKWQNPEKFNHLGKMVCFALYGAQDMDLTNTGLALFPEILKNELHGIRSVIEAHSRKFKIQYPGRGNANGLALQTNNTITLRVDGSLYHIDRWE